MAEPKLVGRRRFLAALAGRPRPVFPGRRWEKREPGDLGLDGALLDQLAANLGGRGCVVRDGYVAKAWGDEAEAGDWMSSAKPVLSTLLMFALAEGKLRFADALVSDFGWALRFKDRPMTLRHLANMVSGYARPEAPGEAWAYNDYAIQLYQRTLFDRLFRDKPEAVAQDKRRLGALGFEDGLQFRAGDRRLTATVRDFARIAWFWLKQGRWGDRQMIPRKLFGQYCRAQVPPKLPHTKEAPTNDYLNIGTFGGESDHFTEYGPGIYGFNWWFNGRGRLHPTSPTWPDAPRDTFMSIGAGGNNAVMLPSLNLVLVSARGAWGKLAAGDAEAPANRHLRLLVAACRDRGGKGS